MMRVTIFCVLAAGCISGGFAQNRLMSAFLKSTSDDSQIVAQGRHADEVRKHSVFMPMIGDAEFRVRNRAWDVIGQRYTIRVTPRGLGETSALSHYNKAQIVFEEEKNRYLFHESLTQRYIAIIDLLERQMTVDSYSELITLYEDRIRVMEQLKNSTDFRLGDLIEAEKGLSKLTIQKIEETQEIENIYSLVAGMLGTGTFEGFDTIGLISVGTIKKLVQQSPINLDENNVTLKYMKRQFELADMRFQYEKAQHQQIVSYIEFSYDNGSMLDEIDRRDKRKSFDLNQAFMVDVGVKLPFLSGGKEDLARRKISYLEDEERYQQIRRDMTAKMHKDTADIRALISQYEFLLARETEVDAEASLKKYLQMSGVDPLVMLDIKENLIKNGVEKATVYYSILRNFVYVLDVTGQLTALPMKNFLLESMEAFSG